MAETTTEIGFNPFTQPNRPKLWAVILIGLTAIIFAALFLGVFGWLFGVIWTNPFVTEHRWTIPVGVIVFSLLLGLTQRYLHAPDMIHWDLPEAMKGGGGEPDAFKALDDGETHLALVGDGPARNDLEAALRGHPVTFTGYLQGKVLATAYASADIFAFPSRTETFGQVVQEAMASGLPVVCFDAEGVRDLIVNGETGLVARDQSTRAFVAALSSALHSDQLRATLERTGARFRRPSHLGECDGSADRRL